ncbi:unnamed protein product, partial [Ectocarpus sp. 8 AP-2014]
EILCNYIRQNSPVSSSSSRPESLDGLSQEHLERWLRKITPLRADIYTALRVIGRRGTKQRQLEKATDFKLDLSYCNLQGASLKGANFSGTNFTRSALDGVDLSKSELIEVRFCDLTLLCGTFDRANLMGSEIVQCTL